MRQFAAFLLIFIVVCAACEAKPRGGTPVPAGALTAGYTINTFHAGSFSTGTVDQSLTYVDGFQWYYYNFFGQTSTPSLNTFNADGSITLAGGFASALATVGQTANATPYVGVAFGCGAYFTAELSFSNQIAIGGGSPLASVVPSFYSFSLEHLVYPAGSASQAWTGQATGYDHFIEIDTLEWNRNQLDSPFSYGSEVHEYWGIQNAAPCNSSQWAGGYCWLSLTVSASAQSVAKGTDNTVYHRFAKLWIPATVSTPGSLTSYYDDIPFSSSQITYTQFTQQAPPPGVPLETVTAPWAFGIVDIQHQVPILLAGIAAPNTVNPSGNSMTVRSVDVWQNSSACNVTN